MGENAPCYIFDIVSMVIDIVGVLELGMVMFKVNKFSYFI